MTSVPNAERPKIKRPPKKRKLPVRTYPEPRTPQELLPLGEDAYHGIAGEIVRKIEPHSEADPAAILVQFLAAFGSAVGRGPGFPVEADRHHANLFVGIAGDTATARKGTSWGQARRLIQKADPSWASQVVSGASSGEGLIAEVRDPSGEDPGVDDKRLFVVESELASVLERMSGSGNTLSPVLRQAWDGSKLDTLVKQNRVTATGAHISVAGHITAEELQRKLTATEQANGFANRFLWIYARRSKLLPRGEGIEGLNWRPIIARLRPALIEGKESRDIGMTEAGWSLWERAYPGLSTVPSGMLGMVIARGAPQVRRLALIYALLERKSQVRPEHLRAALAVWRYAADSAAVLFGHALGDPTADKLLALLRESPKGLTLREIHDAFSRHVSAEAIDRALHLLEERSLAKSKKQSTAGRPATRWYATDALTTSSRKKRAKRKKGEKK